MKYRGLFINICNAPFVELEIGGLSITSNGYNCYIYADENYQNMIGDFTIANRVDFNENNEGSLEECVHSYIDKYFTDFENIKKLVDYDRKKQLFDRALHWIGENQAGEELYNTFSEIIGMNDHEIREMGFDSLGDDFDNDDNILMSL